MWGNLIPGMNYESDVSVFSRLLLVLLLLRGRSVSKMSVDGLGFTRQGLPRLSIVLVWGFS